MKRNFINVFKRNKHGLSVRLQQTQSIVRRYEVNPLLKDNSKKDDPFKVTKGSKNQIDRARAKRISQRTQKMTKEEIDAEYAKLTPEQQKHIQEQFLADVRKYDTPEEYTKGTGFELTFMQRMMYRRYKKKINSPKTQEHYKQDEPISEEDLAAYTKKIERILRALLVFFCLYLAYYRFLRNDGIIIEDENLRELSDDVAWTRYHFRGAWANLSSNMAMIRVFHPDDPSKYDIIVYSAGPLTEKMKEHLGEASTIHLVIPTKHHVMCVRDYLDWEGQSVEVIVPPDFSESNYESIYSLLTNEEGHLLSSVHQLPSNVNTNQDEFLSTLPQPLRSMRFHVLEGEGIDTSEIVIFDKRSSLLFITDFMFNFQNCVFKPNIFGFSTSNAVLKLTGYHGTLMVNSRALKNAVDRESFCTYARSLSRYGFTQLWLAHGEPILEADYPHLNSTWRLKWKRVKNQ